MPIAFTELGLVGGVFYLLAVFGAVCNATFFRIVKVGLADYVPLGLVAPISILVGLFASTAIRPLIGDAKNAALAQDLTGALIILGVFVFMTLRFRRWQGGNP